ncbi:hypothetical protein [Ewingella americana]|uniref:hypothetical protein n=1 Tax=Ewingella americana TaxID=41202 RepID=UPI00163B1019|nr:hypothetical protein [Ewingella americana]QMV54190.1 hypothetical protein GXP68_23230 [Ewingella americana]
MNKLPVAAVLFMAGIIANCLRELMEYSPALTHAVLVVGTGVCLVLGVGLYAFTEIVARYKMRGHDKGAKQ